MTEHPYKKTFYLAVAAVAQAASAAAAAFVAPFDCTVESVEYIASAGITGANTNTRRVSAINKGAAGVGTAEIAGLQFNSGIDAVAFDAKIITLTATQANRDLTAGDVVAWNSAAVASGLADGGGLVKIVVARR